MSHFQSKKIIDVLRMVQDYDLVLPAFQREYVWRPEQVERLFDSLMKGYPINSMLFWRVGKGIKGNYRFYKMIDKYVEKNTRNDIFDTSLKDSFHAIIDGQQRLTSLNLGLRGSYAYRRKYAWTRLSENNYPTRHLYLNLSKRLTDDDGGMTYHFEWMDQKVTQQVDMHNDADGNKWFRVGKVLDFFDKMEERRFYREYDMTLEEESVLARLYQTVFHDESINYYEVDSDEPDIAVDVFVRTNSGGTTLNYADILLSITIANWEQHSRDARTEIYGLVDTVNAMGFCISHDYILKAFLYLQDKDVKMRVTSFDNNLLDTISEQWNDIRDAVQGLFALLSSFGLDHGKLSSYYATLPILYYLYKTKLYKNINSAMIYEGERLIIKKWLMKTLLLRTFGFRSDTALRRARQVLTEHQWRSFPAIEMETALGQSVTDDAFYDTILSCQKDSRQAFSVLSLLYSHLTFEGISYDIDHLHPCAAYREDICPFETYNSVLNLQLLPRQMNIQKSDMPLEEWVLQRVSRINIDRETFLNSALIPDTNLSVENFNEFAEKRKALLTERLKDLLRI